ncbi:conserved hypothetical protein [Gammaproteobacteria bacterium]
MTQESLLVNISQAATTFGVDYFTILQKMHTKELSETAIVRHRGETKIQFNELIRVFGEPKSKNNKKNQGIKLIKPKRDPKPVATSSVTVSAATEEHLVDPQEKSEDGQEQSERERAESTECLHETQIHDQMQKERIERYESSIAELRKIIETFKATGSVPS